jgi:peptide methionine sulfoxide reductase msrA/msrB
MGRNRAPGQSSAIRIAVFLACSMALLSCGRTTEAKGSEEARVASPEGSPAMSKILPADPSLCFIQPSEELRKKLSPEAYAVLVQAATEPPFRNAFWNSHAEGVYIDRIDGTPLFLSSSKFDSGTGWPSFWAPLDASALILVEDDSLGMKRIEVRAKKSGGHLGHLFDDGPAPTGLRYCINSAALDFVPKAELEARGLGALLHIFE